MSRDITIARPYAKAAFVTAMEASSIEKWEKALEGLATVVSHEGTLRFLKDPALSKKEAVRFLKDAIQLAIAPVENFLSLLAYYQRLSMLPEIARQFRAMRMEHEKAVEVNVSSALPLEGTIQDKLIELLKARLKRAIKVNFLLEPELIGGVVIKSGDWVMNGSLQEKLVKLKQTLLS